MGYTDENGVIHTHTINLNKPVYNTSQGLISRLGNPYSKEVKVLETNTFQTEVVFLCEKTKDVQQLKQCFAEVIYNNVYFTADFVGKDRGLVGNHRTGLYHTCNFTILFDKTEFDNYTGVNNQTDMKNKETSMQKSKPKQKKRLSTKVNITYTNGKSFTLKNVLSKVKIFKDKVVVNYSQVKNDGDIKLTFEKVEAEIPSKDIHSLVVLPENNNTPDNEVYFRDGKVWNNTIIPQKGSGYQGHIGYIDFNV